MRTEALTSKDAKRESDFDIRIKAQESALSLPLLPTTTIGSFPQTKEIRQMRARFKKNELSQEEYDEFLGVITKDLIAWQCHSYLWFKCFEANKKFARWRS